MSKSSAATGGARCAKNELKSPDVYAYRRSSRYASRDARAAIGSVVHALIAQPHQSESELLAELDRAWQHLPFAAQWHSANELARHRAMLEAFIEWRAQTRGALTEVGVEVEIEGTVATGDGEVRLRGRVDRLERDAAGRLVIVDIKTGKIPVSKDDAQQHAQLAMYQLAVAGGLVGNGTDSVEPGGARLVYVGKTGASGVAEREQDPLTAAAGDEWREVIGRAAGATSGPQFIARRNELPGQRELDPRIGPAQGKRRPVRPFADLLQQPHAHGKIDPPPVVGIDKRKVP